MIMYTDNNSIGFTQGKHALTPADTHGMLSFSTIMNQIVSGEIQCGSGKPFPIVYDNDKDPWGDSENPVSWPTEGV